MNFDESKYIKLLISQCKALKIATERTITNKETNISGRFSSFKSYASQFNKIADNACEVLELPRKSFSMYNLDNMPGWADMLWPEQLQIIESVSLETDILLSYLEAETEYADDEFTDLENFFKTKLRQTIFNKPTKEIEVQNSIESLLIGRGWIKGIDYDRETGKVNFSGKEYIPDFIIPKMKLCIEVKLVRDGKRTSIIEQINSDIIGYGKRYDRQLYIVYDLGVIRDETEFIRDLINSGENIKVVIIKH